MLLFFIINLPLIKNLSSKRSNLINLNINYEFFNINDLHKSKLQQISSFENTIIVNKWINDFNFIAENNDNFLINQNYILRSLMDYKVNIAIYKNDPNITYYKYLFNNHELYSILIREENKTLFIKRIAININNVENENVNYNSKILLYRLLELKSQKNLNLNFNELHEYDPRYKLSWNI